jgi:ADP-ribose pyrophosphatase YjhB (NUDIX family)
VTVQRTRRIGAYGVCRDPAGRVLLTRGSVRSSFPGWWSLPGGGLEQGEAPAAGVLREFAEETGLAVGVTGLRAALADVCRLPGTDILEHADRIVYDVTVAGGDLTDEPDGTTDRAAWVTSDELTGLPVLPFTAEVLGAGVAGPPDAWPGSAELAALPGPPAELRAAEGAAPAAPVAPPTKGQRFGAYGLVTDPADRLLFTQIAPGYPGAGRWHTPGGGTDHGERPEVGLLRELHEEAGQLGRVTGLLDAAHRHDPAAVGPEGHPIDWHVVRVLFRVEVDVPTEPVVTEAAGGSTRAARWFTAEELADTPLTDAAAWAVRWWRAGFPVQ